MKIPSCIRISLFAVLVASLASACAKRASSPTAKTPNQNQKPPLTAVKTPPLPTAPTPTDAPDALFGLATIGDAKTLLTNVAAYANTIQPGIGGVITTAMIHQGIANLLDISTISGLDVSKPLYVLLLDPKATDLKPFVIAGTAQDPKALAQSIAEEGSSHAEGSLKLRIFGNRVVIGGQQAVKAAGAFALTKLHDAPVPSLPTAVFYVSKFTSRYAEEIKQAQQQLASMVAAVDKGPTEIITTTSKAMFSLLEQTEQATLSLEIDANTATLVQNVQAKPETTASAFIAKQSPSKFTLLKGIPQADIVGAGDMDISLLVDFTMSMVTQAFQTKQGNAELTAAIKNWLQSADTRVGFGYSVSDGLEMLMLLGLRDPKTASDSSRSWLKAAAKSNPLYVRYTRVKTPRFRYKRVPVDEYQIKVKRKEIPADQQEIYKRLYGKKGVITGNQAVAGNQYIATMGKRSRKQIKSAIAQIQTPSAKSHYATAEWINYLKQADQRKESLLIYANISKLMTMFNEAFAKTKRPSAPVLFGIGFAPQTVSFRATVPATTIRSLKN